MGEASPIQALGVNIDLLMRDYADGRLWGEVRLGG
jgi:hypothetical protein